MGTKKEHGFTIIEVTLFLAISGLLAMLLLGGWSTMINTQRYKDSVKTLQSFIQQQYNLVYNVENARDDKLTCNSGGVSPSGTSIPRGQTDCVLMGRYLRLSDGQDFKVYGIVGQESSNDLDEKDAVSDEAAILARDPQIVQDDLGLSEQVFRVPWEAVAVSPSNNALNLVIAIIRSPESGVVHTYSYNTGTNPDSLPDLKNTIVKTANEKEDVPLCLDAGTVFTGGRMGVVVRKYASAQSYVQSIPDGEGVC